MPKGAPTSLCFVSNTTIVAGSTDNTVGLFNLKSGEIIRRFRGHSGIVNSVDVLKGRGLIVSGSDDGTVRVWQEDSKAEVEVVELGYPITAVSSPSTLASSSENTN
jgi:Prp8 binding protein